MNTVATSATKARAQYLAWLRSNFPTLYERATANVSAPPAPGLSGFLDTLTSGFSNVVNSVTSALPDLARTYSEYRQAESLIKLNSQRAGQGLSPLAYNASGQLVTASGQPYTTQDFSLASTGMSTTTWIALGAAGLLGVFLLARSGSRR